MKILSLRSWWDCCALAYFLGGGSLRSSGRNKERARERKTRAGFSFLRPLLPSACYAGYAGVAAAKGSERRSLKGLAPNLLAAPPLKNNNIRPLIPPASRARKFW